MRVTHNHTLVEFAVSSERALHRHVLQYKRIGLRC